MKTKGIWPYVKHGQYTSNLHGVKLSQYEKLSFFNFENVNDIIYKYIKFEK